MNKQKNIENDQKIKRLGLVADLTTVGIQFPVSIGIGYLIGKYLDKFFGIYPWLTVIFAILGVVSAFVNVFRLNARLNKLDKEKREQNEQRKNN